MPTLATKNGTPTGGVYGFAALSLEVIKRLKPDYVAVAWDKPKTNIRRRKELYPGYKAGRKPAPPDFYTQIPILLDLLEAFGWPLYEYDDYEADDIMGALAVKANQHGIEVCLVTSDLDMLQLVGPLTHVYVMKKGFSSIELYNPENFEEKCGLKVDQYLDLKSLKGDSSDNIPGVPGVGEKTAIELLQNYKTLDGVYEHLSDIKETTRKKLELGKESATLSKEIARIWIDAPVPFEPEQMDVTKFDKATLKKILTELEFRSLIRQLGPQLDEIKKDPNSDEPVASNLTPAKVVELDDKAKANLTMASAIVVAKVNETWLLSNESSHAYKTSQTQAAKLLGSANIVAHDAKVLLKSLLTANEDANLPKVLHDTRIANFMLNSLDRNRELADVAGVDLAQDDGGLSIAAIWKLYGEQMDKFKLFDKLAKLASEIEFPTIELLARVEHHGILLDSKVLNSMSTQFAEVINDIEQQIFGTAGYEFNISSPSQLADVLYGKLQLSTVGVKRGKTGYSTGAKELDKLRGTHPMIDLITKYREYTKLKNTYIDTLPQLVDKKGRLHTTYSLDVAPTGRLSSHDPNLQNIPIRTEIGREIRKAFIPDKGNVFIGADYSQFELRLAAILAGDKQFIEDFNTDIDIHAKTASDVYGIPLEKVTKSQRRDAKVINFGVLYGMSPHGLAVATGMEFNEAKEYIRKYFELRAPIRRYIDKTLEDAKKKGYVETMFGRRRLTPDLNSSNFIVREAAKRAAANMPIQGTEADLMKMTMLRVEEQLLASSRKVKVESRKETALEPLGVQVLQIHDSIVVECAAKNADEAGKLLKDTMENVYPKLGVKLKVDISVGKNWGEL